MIIIAMGSIYIHNDGSKTRYHNQSLPEGLDYTGMTCEYMHLKVQYSRPSLIQIALYQYLLKPVQISEFVRITKSVIICTLDH